MKKFLIIPVVLILVQFAVPVIADDFKDGLDAINQGDFETAFDKWDPLAKRGDALAQFNLGLMYDKGEGVKRNYRKAVRWYKLAAKQGIASAQFNLGSLYSRGKGVRQCFMLGPPSRAMSQPWWSPSTGLNFPEKAPKTG